MTEMALCVNPDCPRSRDRRNSTRDRCLHCNSPLQFNGFRATRRLQKDDFSQLYEVENSCGDRQVLQILSLHPPRAVALLQQQAKVLAELHHPGIPRVEPDGYLALPRGDGEDCLYGLLMERIAGRSLADWFARQDFQPISQALALDWLGQLVEILDRLHHNLYFHRDLRPENIILRNNGQLTVVNFASVREVATAYLAFAQKSLVPGVRGKAPSASAPGYAPPEQMQGNSVPQSDFFALGRTFVYLLTGSPPEEFPREPKTGKLLWHSQAKDYAPALISLIDRLMAPQARDRPHSAAQIQRSLDTILLDRASFWATLKTQPQPLPPQPPTRSPRRWKRWHAWLGAGAGLLLLGAIALYQFKPQPWQHLQFSFPQSESSQLPGND